MGRGIECDIRPHGRPGLPDEVLADLDWVQVSVHGGQRLPQVQMTRRGLRALENPHVSCLSHPTGRLINRRPENAVDLHRVYELAARRGVALELNSLPDRIDLSGEPVRDALAAAVQIVCSTDAHSVRGLQNMTLAVATARREGATAADVVTTRTVGLAFRTEIVGGHERLPGTARWLARKPSGLDAEQRAFLARRLGLDAADAAAG